MPIQCDIDTQERTVFSEEVDSVNLPGIEGRMGILPNHSPLLTALSFGEVIIRSGGEEQFFAIGGGILEVQPTKVTILADAAEHADTIDLERAERAMAEAQQVMAEGVPEDPERYEQIRASLLKAQARLDVGRRRRRREMPMGGGSQSQN